MEYKVTIDKFEGPLDLLLHLIKQSDIDIWDINIEDITNQYLEYIKKMEELNLNVASEYVVMAAELIEMKSNLLLPKPKNSDDDEFEEDPKEQLINRLLLYKQFKEVTKDLRSLEEERSNYYTKEVSDMSEYIKDDEPKFTNEVNIDDLINAFNNMLKRQELEKPLNTKIASKEYSVNERSNQIKDLLSKKKKVVFDELFDIRSKDYIVVTFLSILDLAKKQFVSIEQDNNFNNIYLTYVGK